MSTAQSITHAIPRFRIGLRMGLVALGALVALAVAVVILVAAGTSRTSSTSPAAHYAPLIQYPGTGTPPTTR